MGLITKKNNLAQGSLEVEGRVRGCDVGCRIKPYRFQMGFSADLLTFNCDDGSWLPKVTYVPIQRKGAWPDT